MHEKSQRTHLEYVCCSIGQLFEKAGLREERVNICYLLRHTSSELRQKSVNNVNPNLMD
jgi:hypothetical protein